MTRRHQGVLLVVLVVAGILLVRGGRVSDWTLYAILALVPSVILHEVSHGALALAFGDDTAKQAGRLTLNPIAHVDPFGTLILPVLLAIATAGATTFGYAKPVPVNPRRLRDPRNHGLLVSLVGPGVNVVLALSAALLFRVFQDGGGVGLLKFLYALGAVNVVLAVFNLLPIPPLDGSAVVERLLPARYWEPYLRLRQYAPALLLVVVFVLPLEKVFDPALELWERLL